MTSSEIITRINAEQRSLERKKQTALARGRWVVAHECEIAYATLGDLKTEIADTEQREANQPQQEMKQ